MCTRGQLELKTQLEIAGQPRARVHGAVLLEAAGELRLGQALRLGNPQSANTLQHLLLLGELHLIAQTCILLTIIFASSAVPLAFLTVRYAPHKEMTYTTSSKFLVNAFLQNCPCSTRRTAVIQILA